MQPLIWDRRPDGLRAPAMVCAFQGWNDAGDAASSAVSFLAAALDARRFARIDSEEFYDFQANRPAYSAHRGRRAGDRVADGRGLRGARAAGAARPRARAGHRAVDALARLQRAPGRPRRSAGRADGRLAGSAARRRAPHPPGGDDRVTPPIPRWSSAWACSPRATRGRPGSSASCTAPASTRGCRRRACGRASLTTSPPRPTRRRRWRWCAGWKA